MADEDREVEVAVYQDEWYAWAALKRNERHQPRGTRVLKVPKATALRWRRASRLFREAWDEISAHTTEQDEQRLESERNRLKQAEEYWEEHDEGGL